MNSTMSIHRGNVIVQAPSSFQSDYLISFLREVLETKPLTKKIFILVNSREGATQRSTLIEEHIPNCRLGLYYGNSTNVNVLRGTEPQHKKMKTIITCSKEEWSKQIEDNDILIMQAHILIDMCNQRYISMSSHVGTIIIDECHQCVKNHPFNNIMKQYFHSLPRSSQPRVLGLTIMSPNIEILKVNMGCNDLINVADPKSAPQSNTPTILQESSSLDKKATPSNTTVRRDKPFLLFSKMSVFNKQATTTGVYLNVIHSIEDNKSYFGLLTQKPLPCEIKPISVLGKSGSIISMNISDTSRITLSEEQLSLLKEFHILIMSILMNKKEVAELDDLAKLYLVVPVKNKTIDWYIVNMVLEMRDCTKFDLKSNNKLDSMQYGKANIMNASNIQFLESFIAIPRYGSDPKRYGLFPKPIYRIITVRTDLSPSSYVMRDNHKLGTYQKYYSDRHGLNCTSQGPLIQVSFLNGAINGLNPGHNIKQDSDESAICIVPEFFIFYPLGELFRAAVMIPSFMWALEMHITVYELELRLRDELPTQTFSKPKFTDNNRTDLYSSLYVALSSKSSKLTHNYEVLEFIGDDIIKLICCISLYLDKSFLTESDMTFIKSKLASNSYLCDLALEKKLEQYILAEDSTQMRYQPPFFKPTSSTLSIIRKSRQDQKGDVVLYEKKVADVVEALIGAIYLHSGLHGAYQFMRWLGMKNLQQPDDRIQKFLDNTSRQPWVPFTDAVPRPSRELGSRNPTAFEMEVLGGRYIFKDISLLKEALSCTGDTFQRLEFIGDAILDYIATTYLNNTLKNNSDPGLLTLLRSTATCNLTFSALAVLARFHKHITISAELMEKINIFVEENNNIFNDHDWNPIELTDKGTKILGDVFETVAGAIFADSGDIRVVSQVYEPLWRSLLEKMRPDEIKMHPVSRLLFSVQLRQCKTYAFQSKHDGNDKVVEFVVHNKSIGTGRGRNKKLAKREAAINALRLVESDNQWWSSVCSCK